MIARDARRARNWKRIALGSILATFVAIAGVALASGAYLFLGEPLGNSGTFPPLGVSAVVFSSDANRTATATDYQSRSLYVTSSVSLTATRQLVVPLEQGITYEVYNATTGGQAITIGGATGTLATVAQNTLVLAHCPDGANFVSVSGGGGFDAAVLVGVPPVDIDASGGTYFKSDGAAGGGYFGSIVSGDLPTVTLTGDTTGSGAGGSIATTTGKLQGNTVTSGSLISGQFMVASSTSNWAPTTISGDIAESVSTPGQLTVASVTGSGVNEITDSGTITKFSSSEIVVADGTQYKTRYLYGRCTLSDTTTWVTCTVPFTPPTSDQVAGWWVDVVCADMSSDAGGTGVPNPTHDFFTFNLQFGSIWPDGSAPTFIAQDSLSGPANQINLAPANVLGQLDGSAVNTTNFLPRVGIVDAGPDAVAANQLAIQMQGFNTGSWHCSFDDERLESKN